MNNLPMAYPSKRPQEPKTWVVIFHDWTYNHQHRGNRVVKFDRVLLIKDMRTPIEEVIARKPWELRNYCSRSESCSGMTAKKVAQEWQAVYGGQIIEVTNPTYEERRRRG